MGGMEIRQIYFSFYTRASVEELILLIFDTGQISMCTIYMGTVPNSEENVQKEGIFKYTHFK